MYYDKDGLPISVQSWMTLFETVSYCVIKQETANDGSFVSTVWTGMVSGYCNSKPLIFETMAFKEKDSTEILEGRKYPNLKAALIGHEEVVKLRNEAPRHFLRKLEP